MGHWIYSSKHYWMKPVEGSNCTRVECLGTWACQVLLWESGLMEASVERRLHCFCLFRQCEVKVTWLISGLWEWPLVNLYGFRLCVSLRKISADPWCQVLPSRILIIQRKLTRRFWFLSVQCSSEVKTSLFAVKRSVENDFNLFLFPCLNKLAVMKTAQWNG